MSDYKHYTAGEETEEQVTTENEKGTYWRYAVPLPFFLKRSKFGCGCGKVFKNQEGYELHYRKAMFEEIKESEREELNKKGIDMNTHKEPGTEEKVNPIVQCEGCGKFVDTDYEPEHFFKSNAKCFSKNYEKMAKVEPTPPSQIEEESQTQRSLREMYELGKEHGRTLALKDMEIEKLIKEIKGE